MPWWSGPMRLRHNQRHQPALLQVFHLRGDRAAPKMPFPRYHPRRRPDGPGHRHCRCRPCSQLATPTGPTATPPIPQGCPRATCVIAPQAACQTARPSSSPAPVTSPRCSKRHPPWWTCSPPSGPTPVRWSPVSAPARQPRHLTGQQPDSERQRGEFRSPGQIRTARQPPRRRAARRPGWRAPLIRQREDLGLLWRYQSLRVNGGVS
jgi:hypothetical protein